MAEFPAPDHSLGMRGIDLVAVQCVAGLVVFACLAQTDEDDDPGTAGSGGRANPEGGTGDDSGGTPLATGGSQGGTSGQAGTWDTCCVGNRTTECFCAAGVTCNFGAGTEFYEDGSCCEGGDSICTNGGAGGQGGIGTGGTPTGGATGGVAPEPVGGEGGGYWESCCENGVTNQCFCPGGAVCNFGMDVDFLSGKRCCFYSEFSEPSCNAGGGGAGGNAGASGSGGVTP